ncbi:MAG TPA: beta-propeller fold lactonase family protein [Candidatus Sulfotelmatobacter sp.]
MSKRFAWLLGVVVLVSIGVLVACGSSYNASSDGLVLVGSQGSGLIETFSFNLNNGGSSAISNTPADTSGQVCVLNGVPSSIVVDPKGAYAYTIINANTSCNTSSVTSTTGILVFKINSDGTTSQVGKQVPLNQGTVTPCVPFPPPATGCEPSTSTEQVPVVPGMMVVDPAGKFLFIADRATTDTNTSPRYVPGAVSVFAIGSGGSVTEVAGSPFFTASLPMTSSQSVLDIISVAPTPTVYPPIGLNGVQNSVCSTVGLHPPTSQYLYAVDNLGSQVFEFAVNTTSGVLTNPTVLPQQPAFGADSLPVGVAVDPCNRFVYVSGSLNGRISAYTICNGGPNQSSTNCPQTPDGSLVAVAGSPFSLAGTNIQAGPLVVDPFGNYVYVLGTHSNSINILKISPVSGVLAASNPATVATGLGPTSIAIRGDDNWLFVSNFNGPSVSQYSITPATGALTVLPAIQTDNYPWGVAVK